MADGIETRTVKHPETSQEIMRPADCDDLPMTVEHRGTLAARRCLDREGIIEDEKKKLQVGIFQS